MTTQTPNKVVIASQHYPPDGTTTAAIIAAIAEHLATKAPVLVLSGTAGSALPCQTAGRPQVLEIRNWRPGKSALIKRAASEILLTIRMFIGLLVRLKRGDVVLTVTAPFALPYGVVAAAKLKRAKSVVIMHDLFPDVLVAAGLLRPGSLAVALIRGMNSLMFRGLNSIIVIGRDTKRLLLQYGRVRSEQVVFIPNWATLRPNIRPLSNENPYRQACKLPRFIVGLSGNLGFTHDPLLVFEAAKLLQDDSSIHFLLSGWGIGFDQLKASQAEARLPNVTLVERVPDHELEMLLSAANIWVIPYRRNIAGVSIPSRFYNLLAVGRPVVLVSEPDSEAAATIAERNLGWVVGPGKPHELAQVLRIAAVSEDQSMAERAVRVAGEFSIGRAMAGYASLIEGLLPHQHLHGNAT